MEVERERFIQPAEMKNGQAVAVGPEQSIGKEKFEWGVSNDSISRTVGGSYVTNWCGDFLQRELGTDGTCNRLYHDKKIAMDVADPESKIARIKRKLLFRHGFGYLCIPPNFANASEEKLQQLYQAAVREFYAYDKLHPRPDVLQETVVIDANGRARRAFLTALDIKVGGGIKGSVEQQMQELKSASTLSKSDLRKIKIHSRMHRRLREAVQNGTPFRNPFIAPGKRLYPVEYTA